ncbi:MAG: hypothetical protein ACETWK_07405 [Candidatus Aminicenantaceae bacterium]
MDGPRDLALILVIPAMFVFWGWVVWVILEWRKMKHKKDIQNKIVDKFSNVQELNGFLQTEAGENFLKFLRINGSGIRDKLLSSITRGIILAILGIALLIISLIYADEMKVLMIIGIVIIALGVGFLVSNFISFQLGKKWGIIEGQSKNP